MVDSTAKGLVDERVAKQVESLKKLPATVQKNFFEVDPKTQKYLRRFAKVVEIDNERLVIRIDGEDWAIPSAYDLLDLVQGDWILGFAYPGLDGKKKFYPLGPDNEFLEARDARNAFLPSDISSPKDAPEVKAAQAEQNDLKAQLLRLAGEIAGFHASTSEFGQALGQIIQNAAKIANTVAPAPSPGASGQVTAARTTDTVNDAKGRTPVTVRPRDTVPGDRAPARVVESKQEKKRRGRGIKRVQSHFRGQE